MENDFYLRSGTVSPNLPANYVDKMWNDLTAKLNSLGNGPQLSTLEWKRVSKVIILLKNVNVE